MLTNGKESREFLYATDCSEGLFTIMKKFNFFVKQRKELHLTTSKRTKIIDIAKKIKKILSRRGFSIKIFPSKEKDNLQKNVNKKSNKFLLKFWRPKYSIENGIEEIIQYYFKK